MNQIEHKLARYNRDKTLSFLYKVIEKYNFSQDTSFTFYFDNIVHTIGYTNKLAILPKKYVSEAVQIKKNEKHILDMFSNYTLFCNLIYSKLEGINALKIITKEEYSFAQSKIKPFMPIFMSLETFKEEYKDLLNNYYAFKTFELMNL